MRKNLALVYLFILFSRSLHSQSSINENLRILIKDSVVAKNAINGKYDNIAVEVAVSKKYTAISKSSYPIKIALDPGHVAGNKKDAIIEERYIVAANGFFYESELTMYTAKALKKLLTDAGFEVMITREEGESALGYTFDYWFKKKFKKELSLDLKNKVITEEKYQYLRLASKEAVFHQYFKDKDFLARGDKINAFNPDIAVIIHYNATEFTNSPDRYAPEVDYNYSVTFVPGAFTNNELSTQGQMDDFVRLASTNTISKSVQLSSFILDEFNNKLKAKPLLPSDLPDLWYLKKYSTYTGQPGVYGRNLYLTRAPKCPTTYVECFLQNNKEEMARLSLRDTKIDGHSISSRVLEVADCYYTGIVKYFNVNGWYKK
jgi:N-acetylmuramoyl-L-alanine amidase